MSQLSGFGRASPQTYTIEKQITKFPQLYKNNGTPYEGNNFHPTVRWAVQHKRGLINDLRMTKVVLVGDVSVGKSSLVNRFCRNTFEREYKPTIGVDFEVEKVLVLDLPFRVQIWDTAGQEKFKSIARAYYRGANVLVAVFDLSSSESLLNLEGWLRVAGETAQPDALRFLVGTKRDLVADARLSSVEQRAIEFANVWHCEYWACSSKSGDNVREFFNRLAALSFQQAVLQTIQQNAIDPNAPPASATGTASSNASPAGTQSASASKPIQLSNASGGAETKKSSWSCCSFT